MGFRARLRPTPSLGVLNRAEHVRERGRLDHGLDGHGARGALSHATHAAEAERDGAGEAGQQQRACVQPPRGRASAQRGGGVGGAASK